MATNKINSKKKGNRFERAVCKWFKSWTGYEFSRVPASGGLRWKKADNITSDVICTDDKHARKFCFSIECKNYEDIRFEHVLLELKTCKILSFWQQAKEDAKRGGKLPLLVMKYNGMPKGEAFVVINRDTYEKCIKPQNKVCKKPRLAFLMDPKKPEESVFYVMMFSDIKKMDYAEFHKAARTLLKSKK